MAVATTGDEMVQISAQFRDRVFGVVFSFSII